MDHVSRGRLLSTQSTSYARGARVLSVGIATTGVVTFAYFSVASYALSEVEYKNVALLWAVMFVIVSVIYGEAGTGKLLVFSQVILSLQLSFAVIPLVQFTSDRVKMGEFANPAWLKFLAWTVAIVIGSLNAWLLYQTFAGWLA